MKYKNKHTWTEFLGITGRDAMRLARELIERVFSPDLQGITLMNRCRDIISLGIEAYLSASRSVTFRQAVEKSLQERAERRARTTYELRHICQRIIEASPELAEKRLRDISPQCCQLALERTFLTNLQFTKARAVLHSIFSCGLRHGWCNANPVDAIPRPILRETEIEPLPWVDLQNLLRTASQADFRSCMPAVGIMLWAGVRPAELLRLNWEDIDWQEKIINLRPRHSKTGGSRHITLHPVLIAWLRQLGGVHALSGRICPPNWVRKWRALRRAAGITHWQQDVLRHTYASYHLKQWHDIPRLQEEMGHRSARLLRTRYLSMKGITRLHAKHFWTPGKLG